MNAFASWLGTMGAAMGYPTDATIAKALGITQSNVYRWKVKGSRPTVEHLWQLSRLFRTDLEALLVLTGHIPAPADDDPVAEAGAAPLDQALAAAHERIVALETEVAALRFAATSARTRLDRALGGEPPLTREEQTAEVIAHHKELRATLPHRPDDPGVGAELLEEMTALAPLRAEVNAKYLD